MEKHKSLNDGNDAIPTSVCVIREEIAHADTKDFKADPLSATVQAELE